jgi:RNA polymerase primary sigma factor
MSDHDVKFLKDHIKAGIVKGGIIDPADHDVDEILGSYFREILWLAKKYVRPTVEFEDVVVEGLIGLLDAISRFDKTKAKGNKKAFHNLAVVRIKSMMFEYLLSNSSIYTVPNYMARAITLVNQARGILNSYEYEGDPADDLLILEAPAEDAGFPVDSLKDLKAVKTKINNLARNADKSYEEMVTLVLKVERDIESYENTEEESDFNPEELTAQREYLSKFMEVLKEDARDVMRLRLEGKTLEEVGEAMGFTRERARQIEDDTIKFFQGSRAFKEALD